MDDLIAYLIAIIGIVCFFGIVKVISDNLVRKRIADANVDTDTVKAMIQQMERNQKEGALKWGVVAFSTGFSLILIDICNLQPEDPSATGIVIIALGGGLVLYYLLSRKLALK